MQNHKEMKNLVTAYLPGSEIDEKWAKDMNSIKICSDENKIHCIQTWNLIKMIIINQNSFVTTTQME